MRTVYGHQKMKKLEGEIEEPDDWLVEFEVVRTNSRLEQLMFILQLWLLEQGVEHVRVCPECGDAIS